MTDRREAIEDRIPFRYVYLHGLVRDEHGAKMSKTRGNVVDPIALIDTYGADALRFSLITAASTGQDQRLHEEKIEAGRNFANKLWNASRFVIMQLDSGATYAPPSLEQRVALPVEDRWILSRLDNLIAEVEGAMNSFQLNEAGHRMYDFLWGDYCDWYVEMAKVRLRDAAEGQASAWHDPRQVLVHVLEAGLRLLHPYMPFVTEELYQRMRPFLSGPNDALIVAPWPRAEERWRDPDAEREVEDVIDIVRAIRNIRSEKKIEPAREIEAYVATGSAGSVRYIEALARARPLHLISEVGQAPRDGVATAVLPRSQVVVPLAGLLDVTEERQRLEKEIAEAGQYIKRLEGKLGNEQFRTKAPPDVVAAEEERLAGARTRLDGLRRALGELG
jgi:valyl-tRNA synthetase